MKNSKLVCTQADIANLKDRMQGLEIGDFCTRVRANTKLNIYNLTNLTIFASLLKGVPMGCKDRALREPLLRDGYMNCLAFEKNTRQPDNDNHCLFRALASMVKIFKHFLKNSEERDPSKFQDVHMTEFSKVEEILQLNIFLYDIDFVDGELIGELCRRSIQKY